MGSFHEELALHMFSLKTGIELIRKRMKKAILASIDPSGSTKDEYLINAIRDLKRTPDAIAILSPEQSESLGLEKIKTILFCEAEYSNPITPTALSEYADLYDMCEDGYEFNIVVVVIERYGRYQFLDLGSLNIALIHARDAIKSEYPPSQSSGHIDRT